MASVGAISQREWRVKNPDKASQYCRKWREKNKDKIREYNKKKYDLEDQRNIRRTGRFLLAQAKKRAKDRNLPFNIDLSDIIIPTHCPVLGIELGINEGRSGPNSPSLDKTIPSLGYIKGNVEIISWRANQIKTNALLHEVEKLYVYLRKKEQQMNENSDKIYGILRDVKNNVITVEDGFARISGLQDSSELNEKSFKDDQKSELSETKPEDVQTEAAVQAVSEVPAVEDRSSKMNPLRGPEDQSDQPDTREVIFEEGEQEKIEAEENEEKPTRRRKKKTTEDAEDEESTDK